MNNRKNDTHKGNYGHLVVIAGSPGMTGAGCMASVAALRTGCGLVTLALPESLNIIAEIKLTEVMTYPLPQTKIASLSIKALPIITKFIKGKNAMVIGPGLGQAAQIKDIVINLIKRIRIPAIIDADGLNALAGNLNILKKAKAPLILSPHPGEMARLINKKISFVQKNRKKVAKEFVNKYNTILILKGHNTIVAARGRGLYVNKTGNPGMATAGSGDVLSGVVGSLLAQGIDAFTTAKTAVFIHGKAGDLAAKDKGQASLIATDILAKLPNVIKKLNEPV